MGTVGKNTVPSPPGDSNTAWTHARVEDCLYWIHIGYVSYNRGDVRRTVSVQSSQVQVMLGSHKSFALVEKINFYRNTKTNKNHIIGTNLYSRFYKTH
jgi:hypothetical protein